MATKKPNPRSRRASPKVAQGISFYALVPVELIDKGDDKSQYGNGVPGCGMPGCLIMCGSGCGCLGGGCAAPCLK
jgi:hypothetical protein